MSETKKYHPKTAEDLKQIKACEDRISHHKDLIKAVKDNCPHLDQRLETEVYDVHDIRVYKECVVCRKLFRTATDEEKLEALKAHYDDIEVSYDLKELTELAKKC